MFNHSVAADAYVWPGHLHSIQSDPETHRNTIAIRESVSVGGGQQGGREGPRDLMERWRGEGRLQ